MTDGDVARLLLAEAAILLGFGTAEADAQMALSDDEAIQNARQYLASVEAEDDDDDED